jgi:3-oxoacyl-[acyl-carrier protein] reductase
MRNAPNVIVTGGSRGLGLAIATTLAAANYNVIAIARKETEALREAAATAEREQRGAVNFRAFDLGNTGEIARLVGTLRKEFGPLYGLVNNAGIGTAGVLTIMRDEQIENLLRLNTLAPILLTKYVVRSMMVERAGRIVNISSIVASTGYSGLSAYSATKASLVGFTRSLAREVGQLGITVNVVAPGFVDTEMTHDLTGGQREQIVRRSALRRMAEARDVAGSVEFLLSEKARNITGTTLTVDAGNTA